MSDSSPEDLSLISSEQNENSVEHQEEISEESQESSHQEQSQDGNEEQIDGQVVARTVVQI